MTTYKDAQRYIPATAEMLTSWCGPVEWFHDESWAFYGWDHHNVFGANEPIRLDPLCPEVRDHLIRRLSLPDWLRDRPGGLDSWVSAGLVACAVAGAVPTGIVRPWRYLSDLDVWEAEAERGPWSAEVFARTWNVYKGGWAESGATGGNQAPETSKPRVEAYLLGKGAVLRLDADTILLPWPGPDGKIERIWRKP